MNRDSRASPDRPHNRYLVYHDPFWPRIELGRLRECLGLSSGISDTQLEVAARASMELAALEFADWRRCLRAHGYRRLSDIDGHEQGRALSICYMRLVEAQTRWSLAQQVRETTVSGVGRDARKGHYLAGRWVNSSRRRSN